MSLRRLMGPDRILAPVLGFTDGSLTALTLASGKLLGGHGAITVDLALRVALAAAASGAFVFFVARYSQLRGQLVHSERVLSLSARGSIAKTRLGRAVLAEAARDAGITTAASFPGALVPLAASALLPGPAWLGIAVSLALLGLMGLGLARALSGNPVRWALGLVAGALVLTLLGAQLQVV